MSKSRILVVDDDPKLSGLLAVILDRVGGYEMREENRPFAALRTARGFLPNLILLDVDMPGKDGGAIYNEISNDPILAGTPVIFVTSLVSKAEAGVHKGKRYISKPVDPKLLLETVRAILPQLPSQVAA
jgi:CheY-like chemotaxis protein